MLLKTSFAPFVMSVRVIRSAHGISKGGNTHSLATQKNQMSVPLQKLAHGWVT